MSDQNEKSSRNERKRRRNQNDDMMNTPEGVLTPGELDVSDEVKEIEPGRTVVPTDDSPSQSTQHTEQTTTVESRSAIDSHGSRNLDSDSAYAVNISIQTPNGIQTTLIETDDVRELFDNLLVWQVSQIAPDTNPKEALLTLIRSSSLLE